MQAPLRVLDALRSTTETGLVLSTAVSTMVLMATPLVLPSVAAEFDVSAGTAGLFSAVQLSAFMIGSWVSGRVVTPSASVFVIAVALASTREADAYLDPGTGSFVLQALIGTAMAVAFTIKIYWRRLKSLVLRRGEEPDPDPALDDGDP